MVVIEYYVGTTCNNSKPNVASAFPDYFTYTASFEAITTLPNETSANLFIGSITSLGPSVKSEGKERQYVLHY